MDQTEDTNEGVADTTPNSEPVAAESQEQPATETQPEPPRRFAGRFDSPEELEKAYQHLEADYSRKGHEIYQLRSAQQAQAQRPSQADELEAFKQIAEKNPIEAIRSVARQEAAVAHQEARRVRMESAYQTMRQNPEFVELEPVMTQIYLNNQDLFVSNGSNNDPRILEGLFMMARGMKQSELTKKSEQRGRQQGETAAIKKTKAQIEGTSGSQGYSKKKFNHEIPLAEMKKRLQAGEV